MNDLLKKIVVNATALVVLIAWMTWRLDRIERRLDILDDRIYEMRGKK